MSTHCTIFVRDLKVMARAGIFPHEKKARQLLRFNLEITYKRAVKKGQIETINDVISYGNAVAIIKRVLKTRHFDLLETMGDALLDAVGQDKRVVSMKITIEKLKPYAPQKGLLDGVGSLGVTLERKKK